MKDIIALDIGGSGIKAGLIRNKKIVKKIKIDTQVSKGKKRILENIVKSIEEVRDGKIKAIGIGCPGPADYKEGKILNPPNLKPINNFNLKEFLEKKYKVKVRMDNDANCASLAEIINRKEKNFVILTLGTGIGSGVIMNRKLFDQSELGHIIIDNENYLEDLASGTAVKKRARKDFGKKMWLIDLVNLAKKGDKKAKKAVKDIGEYLGLGVASIANSFNPEVIVLTGGMRDGGSYFLNIVKEKMKEKTLVDTKRIEFSKIRDAGLIGAASLVW